MTQTLYSCKEEIGRDDAKRYRISKFVDGDLESSYLTTYDTCECPAGVRPSCRHRQMLPQMRAASIINTHWFWDFDLGRAVDFSGQLKSNIDAMNELATGATKSQPHSPVVTTADFDPADTGSNPVGAAKQSGWRRM